MTDLQKHYFGMTRCWIYAASPNGVRPKTTPYGREIVELMTGGKVMPRGRIIPCHVHNAV